jgi:hypothetical protein
VLTDRHLKILQARGLDSETVLRYGVESSPRLGGDCVAIPFVREGQVVNRKYRTIAGEKEFRQDADALKCFWNGDVIADPTLADQPLVITEGEFDAMIAIQCGYSRTVSVPDGAPAEPIGLEASRKYGFLDTVPHQALRSVREIILATDGDGPGTNLMNDLALRLGRARCAECARRRRSPVPRRASTPTPPAPPPPSIRRRRWSSHAPGVVAPIPIARRGRGRQPRRTCLAPSGIAPGLPHWRD